MSLDFIEQMSPVFAATDETTWFGAIARLAESWGFERTLVGILPRPGLRFEDAFVRNNYTTAWMRAYDANGMAYIDPIVSHCTTHTSPLVWSPRVFATQPQRAMYEEACGHGLRAGVTLPIHGANQETGLLCFVNDSRPDDHFQKHIGVALPNLSLLRDIIVDTSQRYLNAHIQTRIPQLTPRERECLKWTARGKSTWEISHILSCSEAVVNFHMKNIRAKFGVNSRRAAAVMAAQMGLIDPD